MSESLIDIASRLAIFAANDIDEEGDLNHVPKNIIVDAKAEINRLRAELDKATRIVGTSLHSDVVTERIKLENDRLRAENERLKETLYRIADHDLIRVLRPDPSKETEG